ADHRAPRLCRRPGIERVDHDRRAALAGQPRRGRRPVQLAALQRHREHDDAPSAGAQRPVGGRGRRDPVQPDRRRAGGRLTTLTGQGGKSMAGSPSNVVTMRRVTTGSEQLTQLGLTTYEAKAYLALLRRDSFAAADAARVAGVPRQRIYDVLATLVEKGLAV